MVKKIVFSGIDSQVKIKELIKLQRDYPFVEYGFLISESHTNKRTNPRYPDMVLLKGAKKAGLNLSLHLCGKLARDVIKHNHWEPVKKLTGEYWPLFQRLQLNVAGEKKFIQEVIFPADKEILIQCGKTMELYEAYKGKGRIVPFLDCSGGHGIEAQEWGPGHGSWCGYAGGISEENIIHVIDKINEVRQDDYWIDMESSIRIRDRVDMKTCRRICEMVNQKYGDEIRKERL